MAAIDHPEYLRQLTGIDPIQDARGAFLEACHRWDVDFLFGGPPDRVEVFTGETHKALDERTRVTEWGISGSRWIEQTEFKTHEDVLIFEPEKHDLYTVYCSIKGEWLYLWAKI
jgi:hypothetical protein